MSDTGELCQRAALEPISKPKRPPRGVTVCLCIILYSDRMNRAHASELSWS
jgi:hypothetical protein